LTRLAFLAPLILFGCALPPSDPVKEIAQDTYCIQYSSSRGRSPMTPEDRVMLLAAETTLRHGLNYFAIVGIGGEASSSAPEPSKIAPNAALQNVYGIYGVGGTSVRPSSSQVAAAKRGITIKCFAAQPAELIASNAAAVEKDIKKKYSLP